MLIVLNGIIEIRTAMNAENNSTKIVIDHGNLTSVTSLISISLCTSRVDTKKAVFIKYRIKIQCDY